MSDTIHPWARPGITLSDRIEIVSAHVADDWGQAQIIREAILAAVAQALADNAPGWISVKERLPEPGIEVIYYHDTHWQPLPAPPQENKE